MDPKAAAQQATGRIGDELIDLSHRIHAHPELAFEEVQASSWAAGSLADHGFDVEAHACGLDTAFVARAGTGPLHLALCAEYDALPGIGHACGHNMIAAMAVGAGIALAEVADDAGLTVTVLGTPAEEGGGGKILMLDRGAFDGVHAAMMVHPAPVDIIEMLTLAVSHIAVRYRGKSSHASSNPELGINAADAFTVAQTSIGLLRQHLPSDVKVHGIVTKGGDAPNIVPEETHGRWYIRASTLERLATVEPRINRCFEAGALATGCEVEIEPESPPYSEFRNDDAIAARYKANAEALGRVFPRLPADANSGSTDMANVSLAIPTIHPHIGLDCWPVVNHQPEFTARCATPVADRAVLEGALAMAWTAIDVAGDAAEVSRLTTAGKR